MSTVTAYLFGLDPKIALETANIAIENNALY